MRVMNDSVEHPFSFPILSELRTRGPSDFFFAGLDTLLGTCKTNNNNHRNRMPNTIPVRLYILDGKKELVCKLVSKVK